MGPGSDIFVSEKDINEEIIADYPLQRYYTGVLFPEREKVKTIRIEKADAELNNWDWCWRKWSTWIRSWKSEN